MSFSIPLTNERLIEFVQPESPTGTCVERQDLSELLRYHTSEEKDEMLGDLVSTGRFQVLQSFMNEKLEDIHVYRVDGEPRIIILALGTTKDGR